MNAGPAVAETHVSYVFFVGDRAYKLKKPVQTAFLDYSTREARQRICHREVELNRRLAPDVYLGVADVLDPSGDLCDHLVVLRRMPAERRLATRVQNGDDVDDCLRGVARALAGFHAAAETGPEITGAGTPENVLRNWMDNNEQMQAYGGAVLDPGVLGRVVSLAEGYIRGRASLFERRISEGRIRDGHGDVLADDIFCLDDGPRILDCIEFDDRLRFGDVVADAAFLAMDLERLARPDLAERFLASYHEFSADPCPRTLVDHYVAYRAQVRSKVACLRYEQDDPGAREEARHLLDIALARLERSRIRLVLVGGLPGTGKSTLASGIADSLGWTVLRSDQTRKELFGPLPGRRRGFEEGLYRPEVTDAVYEKLLARAERLLTLGEPVILDASWTHERHRRLAYGVAELTASDVVALECRVSEDIALGRIRRRAEEGADPSDATPEVASEMSRSWDRWPEATGIDTSGAREKASVAGVSVIRSS